ncbi:MAG: oxygen-independent coproporphyrinogen III oxidase [Lachnospiraceae bacterium]|nr:oxygen-independent coproporphyrinogen III oxidase [Lachnospiraceae bacterium]
MKTVKKDGLSLYIHIPFCVQKCLYCDFLSFSADDGKKHEYVKALLNELAAWEEILKEKIPDMDKLYFKTVFTGGGTPTCLASSMLLEILQAVKRYTDENTEFTIEANPGTITDSHISVFKEAGINRTSLGLQSAQDSELKKLGRIHTYKEFCNSYQKLQKAGFSNINIDIMADIPGQDIASYKDTLEKVIALEPAHISVYSLIIEPGTAFYKMHEQGELDIADEDTDRQMYNLANEILGKHGYNRYEISNYSKKGMECQHNITYWTDGNYLGTGLGASSYINGTRFTGTRDFNKYTSIFKERAEPGMAENQVEKNIGSSYENLSIKNQMEEFMFLGLRMCKGVSKSAFADKFGISMDKVYGDVIKHFLQNKLLAEDVNSGRIYLTARGIDISNYVLSDFILD